MSKYFLRLTGVVIFSVLLNTIVILVLYAASGWLFVYIPKLNLYIFLVLCLLCLILLSSWMMFKFKLNPKHFVGYTVAWFIGLCLLCTVLWVNISSMSGHRPPSADTNIRQSLMNMRSYGELYYGRNGFSYSGVCNDLDIQNLIKSIQGYGGTVSCYDLEEKWAIESNLPRREEFYCVDSDGDYDYFPTSTISIDDVACGDGVFSKEDQLLFDTNIETAREVFGQEKGMILQMVGEKIAKMRGEEIAERASVVVTYSTTTDSYNFGTSGVYSFEIANGQIYLNAKEAKVVIFQDGGRIFVR